MMYKKYSHIPDELVDMVDRSDAKTIFPRHPHEIFAAINQIMIIKEGKDEELFDEREKGWVKMYTALIVYGMKYEMENDPEYVETVFESFMNGDFDNIESDEASKKLFWGVYKKHLIDSEEYEKIIELKKRNDGTNG